MPARRRSWLRVAVLDAHNASLDIVEMATTLGGRVVDVARVYFEVGTRTGLDWLRQQIEQLSVDGPWQAVARTGLRDNALRIHRRLAERVLARQGARHRRRTCHRMGRNTRRRARPLAAHAGRHAHCRRCGFRNADGGY